MKSCNHSQVERVGPGVLRNIQHRSRIVYSAKLMEACKEAVQGRVDFGSIQGCHACSFAGVPVVLLRVLPAKLPAAALAEELA